MNNERKALHNIRNNVLNTALIIFSLASLPCLAASLSRVRIIGWQPVLIAQVIIVVLLGGVALFRQRLSFHIRAAILIGSLTLLGISGVLTFGLISGSLYFFFIITVLATLLYGPRLGWIVLGAVLLATAAIGLAVIKGLIRYDFDMNVYAVNPASWGTAIFGLLLFLGTTTAFLGRYHAALLELLRDSSRRAEKLAREIAERKAAEQAKKDSEDKFRRIVENMKDIYFESTPEGIIRYCSPSILDVTGYSQDELMDRHAGILYRDPEERTILIDMLHRHGKVRELELVFQRKDGELRDVSLNADFSYDDAGHPVLITGTIRDITDSKQLKQQKHRSSKMEVVGLMAGGVAHDLNNILSGIIGYPELLLRKIPEDSDLRRPLEQIQDSGQRAAMVVADLLTVARGTASSRKTHRLNTLVREYRESPECIQLRERYPNIVFLQELSADPSTISCSPVHIKKCLMNLVMNGAEAIIGTGSITIATRNRTVDRDMADRWSMHAGKYVVLTVSDSGPGIPPADLDHIFEPFYTRKALGRSGTGLGLAVVWNTMEDHHGRVLVTSSEQGTRFELYFPTAAESTDSGRDQHATAVRGGSGEHILVVDDEPQLRELASAMLAAKGYRVDSVSSGEEAVAFVRDCPVDLLILDMIMEPGMSGLETYEAIKEFRPEQKAVIVSGFSESRDVHAALQIGARTFIKKPYTADQLAEAVRTALDSA
jgi:PAS domain S-box-containing protein